MSMVSSIGSGSNRRPSRIPSKGRTPACATEGAGAFDVGVDRPVDAAVVVVQLASRRLSPHGRDKSTDEF